MNMRNKNLQDLEKEYDLELDKAAAEIKKQKAKRVLLQLPDFFKPYAAEIADKLKESTKSEILIYFGSCFGACDIPIEEAKEIRADLIIQFGHSRWNFERKDINDL